MKRQVGSAQWQSQVSALACVLGMVLLASGLAAAAPIVVDRNAIPCVTPSVHYTTIQQAINAAPAWATVQVCPGTYPEQITITQPLTLRGVNAGNGGVAKIVLPPNLVTYATLTWPITAQVYVTTANAQEVTLSNLVIDGSNTSSDCSAPYIAGILFDALTSGTVRQVAVHNQFVHGVNGLDCGSGIGIFAGLNSTLSIWSAEISNVDLLGVYSYKGSVDVENSVISARPAIYRSRNNEGVYFDGGSGTINGNHVLDWAWGIALWYPTVAASTVSNNNVFNCSPRGIYCAGCNGQTISLNKIYELGDLATGIEFYQGTGGNLMQDNQITQAGRGIYFNFSTGIDTIDTNTMQDLTFGVIAKTADVFTSNRFFNVAVNITLH